MFRKFKIMKGGRLVQNDGIGESALWCVMRYDFLLWSSCIEPSSVTSVRTGATFPLLEQGEGNLAVSSVFLLWGILRRSASQNYRVIVRSWQTPHPSLRDTFPAKGKALPLLSLRGIFPKGKNTL